VVRALLVLAAFAGCNTNDPFDCKTSDQCRLGTSTGTCEPSGFCSFTDAACDSGRRYDPSASGDLSGACVPVPDGDHDGIGDADDNCPSTFNPMQENEDGDPYGDACDPCPAFAEPMPPADSDNDGITDLCDSHIDATKPDRIVLFEGFHHGVPNGWTLPATWTVTGDAMVFPGDGSVTLPIPASSGGVYLSAGLHLTSVPASDARVGLALAGMRCDLEQISGVQSLVLRAGTGGLISSAAYAFTAPHDYVLVAAWDRDQGFGCFVADATNPSSMIVGSHAPINVNFGFVDLGTIAGALTYVMIVAQ
jgi:hypothetical protein